MKRGEMHLFVRKISVGNTMVMLANINDTVLSLHEQIQAITGIPIFEQRLIYMGRQLEYDQSLLDCSIQNNAELQLVGRMRSTVHPKAWHIVDDMVSLILRLCRGEFVLSALETITESITDFLVLTMQTLSMKVHVSYQKKKVLTLQTNFDRAIKQLHILLHLSAPAALVMLYLSPIKGNKDCASNLIEHFMELLIHAISKPVQMWSAIIVLEFCNLLRRDNQEDSLYVLCRTTLGSLLKTSGIVLGTKCLLSNRVPIKTSELFPIVNELTNKLSIDLSSSIESIGPSGTDVRDFTAFSGHLRRTILEQLSFYGSKHVRVYGVGGGFRDPYYGEEGEVLYNVYLSLLEKMNVCLEGMGGLMVKKGKVYLGWSQYLPILKELNSISCLFQGVEEEFWTAMRSRKSCICELIVRFAQRADDCEWIFCRKDVMNSESTSYYLSMLSDHH